MRKILVTAFLLSFSTLASADTIMVNGVARDYILDAPVNTKAAPLLVALHGSGGSDAQLRRTINLSAPANQAGIVVVYPNGIDKGWNDGRLNRRGRIIRDTDDVGFLTALVNDLVAKGVADPAHVVFTGIS
jgi:polyhydroxybutyrate depolymerase